MALSGVDRFSLLNLPSTGVWRLTDWNDPFDPPPPPPSVSQIEDPENDDSRRWDAPDGGFRTLYCATEAVGAFGEKLSDFTIKKGIALEIEQFLESEPDEEFADERLVSGLNREQVEQLNWKLAWAPTHPEAKIIDISARRTQIAILPGITGLLRAFGFRGLDSATLKTRRRAFTRQVAGYLHQVAEDEAGGLAAFGIRYESRLPPAWECWALWLPLPLDVEGAKIEDVTFDHPALRTAAALLDVPLLGG